MAESKECKDCIFKARWPADGDTVCTKLGIEEKKKISAYGEPVPPGSPDWCPLKKGVNMPDLPPKFNWQIPIANDHVFVNHDEAFVAIVNGVSRYGRLFVGITLAGKLGWDGNTRLVHALVSPDIVAFKAHPDGYSCLADKECLVTQIALYEGPGMPMSRWCVVFDSDDHEAVLVLEKIQAEVHRGEAKEGIGESNEH